MPTHRTFARARPVAASSPHDEPHRPVLPALVVLAGLLAGCSTGASDPADRSAEAGPTAAEGASEVTAAAQAEADAEEAASRAADEAAAEQARLEAEAEAQRLADEEARQRAEEEARRKAEEEARRRAEVTRVQEVLAAHHYYAGAIDGEAGPATAAAVMAFQKVNGLSRDGVDRPPDRWPRSSTPSPAPLVGRRADPRRGRPRPPGRQRGARTASSRAR